MDITVGHNIYATDQLVEAHFLTETAGRAFAHSAAANWTSRTASIPHIDGLKLVRSHRRAERVISALFAAPGALALVKAHSCIEVLATADSSAAAQAMIDAIRVAIPPIEASEDQVPVRFWTLTKQGPRSEERTLDVPSFAAIAGNYHPDVAGAIGDLAGPEFAPGRGGRLVLWHGAPGGGKTYALRALAREWRDWATFDYIVDPDAFFGQAAYMMDVLLSDNQDRWRVVVCEDTGELLSADARERSGQGLSRLLNAADGFIGQGLKMLVLITTNEELGRLHPAVTRPGRCAATIAFRDLDAATAARWAASNGITVEPRGYTLADLFALRDGRLVETPGRIGFRAA